MKKATKKDQFFKKYCSFRFIRPILYKVFSHFIVGLLLAYLWNRFSNAAGLFTMQSFVFQIIGILYGLIAWFSFLGLDGMRPFDRIFSRPQNSRKKSSSPDLIDFIDEKVTPFDELEPDERSFTSLAANLICCALFLGLSVLAA
ncbi:MAG: hypothetical protein LIP11_12040 [Clostridiales bacterium]|nr:hypothetical protein [Clostridiales bacterium]